MKQFLKTCFFTLFLFVTLISCKQPKEITYYNNPVIRGDMADPSIIRIGDSYYATATSSEWAPFYPVFVSDDLINWQQTGHIFNDQPEWTSSSFWAPELFYHNNKVYCYYTARRKSDGTSYIGVASVNSPTDQFTDHGIIVEYGTEAIDAFIFDDNGQLYITWKAYGLDKRPIEIIGSKLSADGLRLEGEPFTLLTDDENIGMEGQYHFKKGEYYYLVYSSRGCCGPASDYDVCVARSKSFKGPYEKYEGNPILHGGAGSDYISCGHGTAITSPDGRMFYMCHAYLAGDGFYQGRQPVLYEMVVGEDNWIHFPSGEAAQRRQPVPFENTVQKDIQDIESPYDWWTWNYPYADVRIEQEGKSVILSGTSKSGNLYGCVAAVRSVTPEYYYETQVNREDPGFKGLTMYGDNENLVMLGVEGNKVLLKYVLDGNETIKAEFTLEGTSIYLKMDINKGCFLTSSVSKDGLEWDIINTEPIDCSKLTRWDRVSRPGLMYIDEKDGKAKFNYFKLKNKL